MNDFHVNFCVEFCNIFILKISINQNLGRNFDSQLIIILFKNKVQSGRKLWDFTLIRNPNFGQLGRV